MPTDVSALQLVLTADPTLIAIVRLSLIVSLSAGCTLGLNGLQRKADVPCPLDAGGQTGHLLRPHANAFILATNCDLCLLAVSSCRLLSWISSNSRTFSIAIAAWSAKVDTSSICFSVNARTSERDNPRTPMGTPSRNIGTPRTVR